MSIKVIDSRDVSNPESRAVLQALASRSLKPIDEQVLSVNQDKTEKFISQHVIGYNHDSVLENADSVIISLSDISMFAAKAIEDTSLFRGTESSTRYIDFEHQPFITPVEVSNNVNVKLFTAAQNSLRKFYVENLAILTEEYKERFPVETGQSETVWLKAVKAKAFDVMRSFLPGGAATTVNWGTDLRHAKERISKLKTYHLTEVQDLAFALEKELNSKYPSSVPITPMDEIDNHYLKYSTEYHQYAEENVCYGNVDLWNNPKYKYQMLDIGYTQDSLELYRETYPSLQDRPKGASLPRMYGDRFTVSGLIDFGSFRDVQRHRNGICKIPLLTTENGFEDWYLEQLTPEIQEKANYILFEIEKAVKGFAPEVAQYIIPMGYRMPFLLDYDLAQMVYFTELRSSKHVHPTARLVAHHTADFFDTKLPWLNLYTDRSEGAFNIGRGRHDITKY